MDKDRFLADDFVGQASLDLQKVSNNFTRHAAAGTYTLPAVAAAPSTFCKLQHASAPAHALLEGACKLCHRSSRGSSAQNAMRR